MKPDPLDEKIRLALDVPAPDVARVVREALDSRARARVRGLAVLAYVATVFALGILFILLQRSLAPEAGSLAHQAVVRIENRGQVVLLEDRLNRHATLFGGDRTRDRFRSTTPRILITLGEKP